MKDCLREYNLAGVRFFIEALDKTRSQYYQDRIDVFKDAVSIPGILMTYVLTKALQMKKNNDANLCAPGQPCIHKCEETCTVCIMFRENN